MTFNYKMIICSIINNGLFIMWMFGATQPWMIVVALISTLIYLDAMPWFVNSIGSILFPKLSQFWKDFWIYGMFLSSTGYLLFSFSLFALMVFVGYGAAVGYTAYRNISKGIAQID